MLLFLQILGSRFTLMVCNINACVDYETVDNEAPIAAGIVIGRNETRFTGKIHKITLTVKDVK